ncbi:unnamed protein product [Taenia asiatica]|uniref:Bravo_FIGEY domain-containing protein n=1 Tax=Taenia asiatica TaxID=60517 RepID=A0A0R3VT88_TAEAS|nr:unnamed protein product [Taenia asiatica]
MRLSSEAIDEFDVVSDLIDNPRTVGDENFSADNKHDGLDIVEEVISGSQSESGNGEPHFGGDMDKS